MKLQPKPNKRQLNLPLLDLAPTELPPGEQQELTRALAELLLDAAAESGEEPGRRGGRDNVQAHE
jgi:hypothetical protein